MGAGRLEREDYLAFQSGSVGMILPECFVWSEFFDVLRWAGRAGYLTRAARGLAAGAGQKFYDWKARLHHGAVFRGLGLGGRLGGIGKDRTAIGFGRGRDPAKPFEIPVFVRRAV